MADGKVVIDSEIDDNGISRGIKNIKDKLRSLDSSLIRTAALGTAITIAPTAVPAVAALTGGVLALSSAFGAAGVGVLGFGAVAVPTLKEVFEANENIMKAEEKLAKADSAKERAAALEELKAATAGLSDAQKEALKSYQEFTSFWDEFAGRFQEPVLNLFTSSLQTLKTLLEMSEPAIQGAAKAFENLMKSLNQSLGTTEVQAFFDYVGKDAGPSIEAFGQITGNVLLGVMNLMRAFSPLAQQMLQGLVGLSQRFAEWTASLNGSAAFQSFVDYVRANGPTLLSIIGNLAMIIVELGKAFAPFGSAVLDAINVITGLVVKFLETQPAIAAAGAAVAMFAGKIMALAPIIAQVGSVLAGAVKWFIPITTEAGETITVLTRLRNAFAVLTGPIGIVVAAVTGLIAIFAQMWQTNEEFRNKVTEIWTAIQATISTVISAIGAFIMQIWGEIKAFWDENQNSIKAATQNVWSIIQAVINTALTAIMAIFKAVWPVLKFIVESVWESIKGAIQGALKFIQGLIQLFSGIFTGDFSKMWDGIKNIFSGAIQAIWNIVNLMLYGRLLSLGKALFTGLQNTVVAGWSYIKSLFQGSVSSVSTLVSNGFTTIKTIINFTMNSIKSIVTGIWNGIKATTTSVMNGIKSVITGVWNAINSIISTVVNSIKAIVNVGFKTMKNVVNEVSTNIKSIITKVWNDITSFLKGIDLFSIGKNIMQGLLNGINSMVGVIQDKVKDVANSVLRTFKSVLDIHSPSRETEKLGKYTGQGFAKGIESKKNDAAAAAKKTAEAAKKAFEEQFKTAQYNFKIGKIDESQYISKLRTISKEYAKTSDQVRKVNLEIKRVQEEQAKKTAEIAKKTFEQGKQAIEYQKQIRNVSLEQELQWWNNLAKKFKEGTKERMEAEKEFFRVKDEITKRNFENEKKWFEERKYYGQLSLTQELESLNTVAKRYKKGTEERIYWEREIYRVKKEINDRLLAANNEYAQKVKEINERLYQDELKAKEEYEQKVKEINNRLLEEERKLTEEYQKAVEDRAKSLYSFAGIFDEIKRKDDVTGQGLLKNLSDQVSAFKDWQGNIVSLSARGIDDGLLQELREMGPKAVDEIAALNSLSDEELQQYVALWREKNALARTQAVNELEGMRLDTQAKIQQLRATANAELEQTKTEYVHKIAHLRALANAELEQHKKEWMAKVKEISEGTKTELNLMSASMVDIGKNSMQGLIDGLNSMIGPLQKKAKEIASIVESTMKATLKIKSPSRVLRDEVGKWIPLGVAEGIDRNISAVVAATNRMAQAAIPNVGASGSFGISTQPSAMAINIPKMASAKIEQNFHFHSTAPTPSEVARKNLQVSRQLAMEWGL
jgi:phage-related protein